MKERSVELARVNNSELEAEVVSLKQQLLQQERTAESKLLALRETLSRTLASQHKTQSELLEQSNAAESVAYASAEQVSLYEQQLELSNQTVASLKKHISELQQQLHSTTSAMHSQSQASPLESERTNSELTTLRSQLTAAEHRVSDLQSQLTQSNTTHTTQLSDLHSQLDAAHKQISTLQQHIQQLPSRMEYLSLKKQLAILQEMEFHVEDSGLDAQEQEEAELKRTPAELLLLKKNRKYENDLMKLKVLASFSAPQDSIRVCIILYASSAQRAVLLHCLPCLLVLGARWN